MNAAELLRAIVNGNETKLDTFVAEVTKVEKRTCDVKILCTGAPLTKVRLNTHGENLVIKPKEKSNVIVCKISESDYFVAHYSEIAEVILNVSDNGKIVINGGENDGLVKIKELNENLNNLKDFVKDLATNIYTWGSALDGLALGAVKTNETLWKAQAAAFTFKNMENDKIKH